MTRVSSLVRASRQARARGYKVFAYNYAGPMIYAYKEPKDWYDYLCLVLTNDGVWALVDTNDPYGPV